MYMYLQPIAYQWLH